MQITLKVFQEEDLLDENASYSLGWIEIVDKAKEISFFKDKLCMIFLTTSGLIDDIQRLESKKVREVRWVGEDHGSVFILSVNNTDLCIKDDNAKIFLNLQNFKSSLFEGVNSFLEYCSVINSEIQKESAFIDLKVSLQELKT